MAATVAAGEGTTEPTVEATAEATAVAVVPIEEGWYPNSNMEPRPPNRVGRFSSSSTSVLFIRC